MPLHYGLICPYGTTGWTEKMSKSISMMMFYRQILLRCETLHLLPRLLNEFAVDMFSAIENNRLGWIRHNQHKIIRKEDLHSSDDQGRIFLPASFIGSFRHNQKLIADGLAIVSRLKNPTYFITFTCNPMWSEINARLLSGQNASDRPDVVALVSKQTSEVSSRFTTFARREKGNLQNTCCRISSTWLTARSCFGQDGKRTTDPSRHR